MVRSSRELFLLCACAFLGQVWHAPATARADEPPQGAKAQGEESQAVVDAILAKWKSYRDEMRSVRYEATSVTMVPKNAFKDDKHVFAEDHRYDSPGTWLINFSIGEYRIDRERQSFNISDGRFRPDREIVSYVGGELRCHRVSVTLHRGRLYSESQPEFVYNRSYSALHLETMAPLVAHAYVPRCYFVTGGGNRNEVGAIQRHEVELHGTTTLDGRECHVLRCRCAPGTSPRLLEFWVDNTDARLVRRVRTSDRGEVWDYADLTYDVRDGRALLQRWRYVRNHVVPPERPIRIVEMTVTAFLPNPQLTSDDLQLKPQPGMLVMNERTRKRYAQPAPGEHAPLVAVISQMCSARMALVVAAGLVVLAFGFDQVRSRSRRKRAAGPKNQRFRPRLSFAVKTLLLVVALCAIAFGYLRLALTEQSRLVTELKKRGAIVTTAASKEAGFSGWLLTLTGETPVDVVSLNLQGTTATDDDLVVLARFPRLARLEASDHITGEGLRHLQGNAAITSLDLSDSRVSDETLRTVGELRSLQSLSLDGTRVTDVGIAHLRGLTELVSIDVRNTDVTPEGLEPLFAAKTRTVTLMVDKEDGDAVKRLLPKAVVFPTE
jgi:hypothetical protein